MHHIHMKSRVACMHCPQRSKLCINTCNKDMGPRHSVRVSALHSVLVLKAPPLNTGSFADAGLLCHVSYPQAGLTLIRPTVHSENLPLPLLPFITRVTRGQFGCFSHRLVSHAHRVNTTADGAPPRIHHSVKHVGTCCGLHYSYSRDARGQVQPDKSS